jgi:ankyrin repeat protein
MLRLLLTNGTKVDTRDLVYGETPLMNAAAEGQGDVLLLLIKRGAQLDATSKEGETALDRAVRRGQTSAVRILIKHGASPLVSRTQPCGAAKWTGRSAFSSLLPQ